MGQFGFLDLCEEEVNERKEGEVKGPKPPRKFLPKGCYKERGTKFTLRLGRVSVSHGGDQCGKVEGVEIV